MDLKQFFLLQLYEYSSLKQTIGMLMVGENPIRRKFNMQNCVMNITIGISQQLNILQVRETNMRSRKNSGSQQETHVRCQIYCIKKRLIAKQAAERFISSALYNDFLIVETILNTVPEHIFDSLEKELSQFDSKLRSIISELNEEQLTEVLSLKPIANILKTVQQKDTLLQDFLTCGGYYQD